MRFMTDVGMTICIVMVSSLLVALTVVPMVAAILLKGESSQRSNIVRLADSEVWMRHRLYSEASVCFLLEHRGHALWVLGCFSGRSSDRFRLEPMERQVALYIDTPRHLFARTKGRLHEELFQLLMAKKEELEIADITTVTARKRPLPVAVREGAKSLRGHSHRRGGKQAQHA